MLDVQRGQKHQLGTGAAQLLAGHLVGVREGAGQAVLVDSVDKHHVVGVVEQDLVPFLFESQLVAGFLKLGG